jgi:hypothetical protein
MDAPVTFDPGFPTVLSRPEFGTTRDGSWKVSADLRKVLNDGRALSAVSCAKAPNSELHVCAIDLNGILLHTLRNGDGAWQNFWGDVQTQTNLVGPNPGIGKVASVACAVDGSSRLHLCVIDTQGGLWHTIRTANGKWPFRFGDVQQQTRLIGPNPGIGPLKNVACAANNLGQLHVLVLDNAGKLWHTMRFADGTWPSAFGDVQAETNVVGPNPGIGALSAIACANDGNQLHVCVIDIQSHELWHTIRHANGSWPFRFGDVQAETGPVTGALVPLGSVACVAFSGRLHVLTVTAGVGMKTDGFLAHTIREQDGGWQPLGDIKQQARIAGGVLQCSIGSH